MRRIRKNTIPISDITAKTVAPDGAALRQADHAGVTQRFFRAYCADGMVLVATDCGNNTLVTQRTYSCDTLGRIDCKSMWYGEIRGSYYDQCAQIKKGSSRKECAIRGSKRSVLGNLRAMRSQFGESQMQQWKCYETEDDANNAVEKAYNQMKQDPNNPFE